MARIVRVAACQVGRIDRGTPKADVVQRLIVLLEKAAAQGVKLAVFPETTFSTFFPRYYWADLNSPELAAYFEEEPTGPAGITEVPGVKAFFEKARKLNIDVAIGYGERTPDGKRYNTASYVSAASKNVIGKYRKIHLPGTVEPFDAVNPNVTNQLEKRYFLPGDLGFQAFRAPNLRPTNSSAGSPIVGMLICNDRRWAEGWRAYGLQGVEIMCIGYVGVQSIDDYRRQLLIACQNTTAWAPQLWGIDPDSMTREAAAEDAMFHHKLVCQAHAYTNATFLITAARCGVDDGIHPLISGSMIVDPEGHIVAENKTEADEVISADIDLDACQQGKQKTFCFAKHRRIEHYGVLVERAGVVEPDEPSI